MMMILLIWIIINMINFALFDCLIQSHIKAVFSLTSYNFGLQIVTTWARVWTYLQSYFVAQLHTIQRCRVQERSITSRINFVRDHSMILDLKSDHISTLNWQRLARNVNDKLTIYHLTLRLICKSVSQRIFCWTKHLNKKRLKSCSKHYKVAEE